MTSGIVFPPRLDQEALADPVTAALFEHRVRRVRLAPLVWGALAGSVAVAGLGFTGAPYWEVAAVLAGLMIDMAVVGPGPRAWGWPRVRTLLARERWRQTGAVVLAARGTLVELADGTVVRVWDVPPPVRDVIASTGRVWVIGPDPAGWLALRTDGVHTPWPARVVRRSGTPVVPTPVPLPAYLMGVRRASLVRWLVGAVLLALVSVVALAGCLAMAVLRFAEARRLRRFVGVTSWQRLEVTLEWGSVRHGTATATVTAADRTFVVPSADLNLLANAQRSGVLWVAPGVAGYPDFPLLARTR